MFGRVRTGGRREASRPVAEDAIEHRAAFDFVRYANCWEDADLLQEALQSQPGHRVLSIASAGDNTLALLASGAEVVAADLNPAQLACLELRCAAFRRLDHATMLAFLGIDPCRERHDIYHSLRDALSSDARRHWDARREAIAGGVVHAGKFEAYFRLFRTRILPWLHSRDRIAELLRPKPREDRIRFWDEQWNHWRWRLLIRAFFSRPVMGALGRDREFFRYVEGGIAGSLQRRIRHALTELDPSRNPYLQSIATGNFSPALPRYLRPEHFEAIRRGLDRLTLHHGPIDEAAATYGASGFDGFNLSDVFEYISPEASARLYGRLLQFARPGARLVYWNAFVPRSCPEEFLDRVEPLTSQAENWRNQDQAFFYSRFHVDQVRPAVSGPAVSEIVEQFDRTASTVHADPLS